MAGPAFAQIARVALDALGWRPPSPQPQLLEAKAEKGATAVAVTQAAYDGPSPASSLAVGIAPNLAGMSLRQVLQLGASGKFSVRASGWGRVVSQRPAPGQPPGIDLGGAAGARRGRCLMRLMTLIKAISIREVRGDLPTGEVKGLTYDSRRAAEGMLFAALPGAAADGHDFVAQAAQAGALACLVQRPVEANICQIVVEDSRLALALLANEFYGRPSREMTCLGVTGTNGKTTVTYLLESVLAQMGPVGVIGTVEIRFAGQKRPATVTTPESVDLQALLREMRSAQVGQAVMELSSHALIQHRPDGVALDAAVFTNLSRDHLDYHGDLEAYFAAKKRLFTEILPASQAAGKRALAVICLDDPQGVALAQTAAQKGLEVVTYGFAKEAMVRAEEERLSLAGGSCHVLWPGGSFEAQTRLVGRYNLLNLLAAAAVGLGLGMNENLVAAGLSGLVGVPGRLERVQGPAQAPAVFVDYAHTDDALRQMLATLKPLTCGRLICVFGAGGDRDHGKRPLMGRAVAQGADIAVLTSDNPRTEDPLAIIAMIEPGLKEAGAAKVEDLRACSSAKAYAMVPDRARAVALAIAAAARDDVVVIAGKGHEDYQIVGHKKRHLDDREEAAAALAAAYGPLNGGCRAQAGC